MNLLALVASVALSAAPVDINRATAAELSAIDGIGPQVASAIVEYRAHHGPFARIGDLTAVPGVGSATLRTAAEKLVARPFAGPSLRIPVHHGATESTSVDINTASADELATLPGVGPIRAADIVRERQINGRFRACDDLRRVAGIGPATVAVIGDRCKTDVPDDLALSAMSAARPER